MFIRNSYSRRNLFACRKRGGYVTIKGVLLIFVVALAVVYREPVMVVIALVGTAIAAYKMYHLRKETEEADKNARFARECRQDKKFVNTLKASTRKGGGAGKPFSAFRASGALGEFEVPWEIPEGIDLREPFIYYIAVMSAAGNEYRYVGKGRSPSRLKRYNKNVNQALRGEPKRPLIKQNGEPQSDSNVKYRYVHLALTKAAKEGWRVEGRVITNCPDEEHEEQEQFYIRKYNCNLNYGKGWFIGEFEERAAEIR